MNENAAPQQSVLSGGRWSPRRVGLWGLGLTAALGLLAYGGYWLSFARYYETTDDAYVNDDLVQVTSEVPGTVIMLSADDTQGVSRGQTLLQLDPADAQIARSNAEARLARTVREVRSLFATAEQLRARIADRE